MNERNEAPWLRLFAIGALCVAALMPQGGARAATPPTTRTSVEQMYSLPSIIGTSPEGYAWSRDGRQLAFLWNDGGLRFRDVWIHTPAGGANRQLTHFVDARPKESEHNGVSEVVWLDNGASLAYVLDGKLYSVDRTGSSSELEPERAKVRALKVSPDGRHLAFTADGGLWVRGVAGAEPARRLSGPGAENVRIDRYDWAANNQSIAFMELDDREVRQIDIPYSVGGEQKVHHATRPFPGDAVTKVRVGVADVANSKLRWLDLPAAAEEVWGVGISSDGGKVFVDTSDFLIKARTIYLYDLRAGTQETFYVSKDATRVAPNWSAAWAPGDDGLVVVSDEDGFFHLYHIARAGETPRRLTGGDWEVTSFEVDRRNRAVYFLANESHQAELQFYRVPMSGGAPTRLSRSAGTHAPVYSPDFSLAADRFSNDTTPPDLYLADLRGRSARRITTSPRAEFAGIKLAKVSYVEFKSHIDGVPIHARLMVPPDFDPGRTYPLLMGSTYRNTVRNRWGGGNELPTWGLDQVLADRGYVLMKVDTRGSWGHGSGARKAQYYDFGGIDIEDLESGVRYMVSQGYVDSKRVGVWGWSYGGLMTLMSMFKKPDLYACGIADAPASNVAHAYPRQMWVMGLPKGDDFPARYDRQSAVNFTAGLKKPLMITQASKDEIVLYSDTVAVTERLIAQGKMFELVTLPGSSHIWAKDSIAQQKFAYTKMAEFFDRHLRPESLKEYLPQ